MPLSVVDVAPKTWAPPSPTHTPPTKDGDQRCGRRDAQLLPQPLLLQVSADGRSQRLYTSLLRALRRHRQTQHDVLVWVACVACE